MQIETIPLKHGMLIRLWADNQKEMDDLRPVPGLINGLTSSVGTWITDKDRRGISIILKGKQK